MGSKNLQQVIHIRNKDRFYKHLLTQKRRITATAGNAHETRFSDSAPGMIDTDGAISLHPYKLSFLTAEDMEEFLNICSKLKEGTIVDEQFKSQIQGICKKYKLHFRLRQIRRGSGGLTFNGTKISRLGNQWLENI